MNHVYHPVQLNTAQLKLPLDHPGMAGFVNNLAAINQLAESSAGFVWRLQDESGDETSIRAFDDPMIVVNMSVWQSANSLRQFVYKASTPSF